MIKVRALDTYKKNHIMDNQLNKIPEPGYEFEVSDERYKQLTQQNEYNLKFVEKVVHLKEKPTNQESE